MKKNTRIIYITFFLLTFTGFAAFCENRILIPMDMEQTDHLKAYGLAYNALENGGTIEWLLNYRCGSFLAPYSDKIIEYAAIRGIKYEVLGDSELQKLDDTINESNMSRELLEKAPKIAVYTPPGKLPWDDAVTLALTYAEIPYTTLWDAEVLAGELSNYDWIHLHHEDFTGQYGKFYGSYRNSDWYIKDKADSEIMAHRLGFEKVSIEKKAVAEAIRAYVEKGGFLFAMCSATDTIDIALATGQTDIVPAEFDGDGFDADYANKLDFSRTFAFENFKLITDPYVYEFSNIDVSPTNFYPSGEALDYFELFEFSAKYDPVPTMLTQDHENPVKGFMGQTTEFNRNTIKKNVLVMGENKKRNTTRYIHGDLGKGTFTFLGGHDPEDYQHRVGDPQTQLFLHKHSAGYRLILNNVLFPGARKKELKT